MYGRSDSIVRIGRGITTIFVQRNILAICCDCLTTRSRRFWLETVARTILYDTARRATE